MYELHPAKYQNHYFGLNIFCLNKILLFSLLASLTMFLKSLKFASSNHWDSQIWIKQIYNPFRINFLKY